MSADCTLGPMRVLVAPDKFRGTLTAHQAASAIATGWRRVRPGDEVDVAPMADGGEGTLDALMAAFGGDVVSETVTGPLGDPVHGVFGLADAPTGRTAVVELARASGLSLVDERRRDAIRASSRGTGELVLAACRRGARTVIVCIGGSASTDGGSGIAMALGVRLLDAADDPIPDGGAGLLALARIDARGLDPSARRVRFVVASDVDNPLGGPSGAARVFGPQKGAGPDEVLLLERALGHLAAAVHRDLGIDVRHIPGGGAAGGVGAGLIAFLGARIRSGVEVVMGALGLAERIAASDLVVTGEGRLDPSSLRGKVVSGVLGETRRLRVATAIVCGRAEVAVEGVRVASLVERFGEDRAMEQTRPALEDLAAEVALDIGRVSSGR